MIVGWRVKTDLLCSLPIVALETIGKPTALNLQILGLRLRCPLPKVAPHRIVPIQLLQRLEQDIQGIDISNRRF